MNTAFAMATSMGADRKCPSECKCTLRRLCGVSIRRNISLHLADPNGESIRDLARTIYICHLFLPDDVKESLERAIKDSITHGVKALRDMTPHPRKFKRWWIHYFARSFQALSRFDDILPGEDTFSHLRSDLVYRFRDACPRDRWERRKKLLPPAFVRDVVRLQKDTDRRTWAYTSVMGSSLVPVPERRILSWIDA